MFIFVCLVIVMLSLFLTNKALKISSENSLSYSSSKRDTFIILGFFIVSIICHKLIPSGKIYWISCGIFAAILLMTMVVLGTMKKIVVAKQREEIESVFEVLAPVIPNEAKVKDKETGVYSLRDINNPPFKLGYEDNKINKITVKINPNTFKEPVAVDLCLSLNKYLPNYEWVNQFDFAARECSFVGTPLPPKIAKYKGSWLRPAEFIPIGLSGLGEVSWNINSFKDAGRSCYIYEDGKVAKTVQTPPAPQSLTVGSPLGLDTIIPTTTGYKTMGNIEVGDYVFGFNNKPVRVSIVHDIIENPKHVYKLVFSNENYSTTVISDSVHRFPVLNSSSIVNPVKCEDLKVGDIIIGMQNSKLTHKIEIEPQPVRCITVEDDYHLFLITDKKSDSWLGGNQYDGDSIFVYNTGGGKSVFIYQEVEVQDDE